MSKQTKTPTEKKKSLKTSSRICFFSEFISVFAPFITIGLVNYEKYFVEYNGTKISIGFVLAMIVMGVATWLVSKEVIKQPFIVLLIAWAVVTGILFLVKELLSDLCYIMLFGWLGIAGAYGLNIGKKHFDAQIDEIDAGIKAANQEIIKDAYKEELKEQEQEKKTVKVRIRK